MRTLDRIVSVYDEAIFHPTGREEHFATFFGQISPFTEAVPPFTVE